ncbi:type II toxin-antitoxin system HicB family antitoxin [candidate division WOR-3 bacterium]|nr:type II toxin-antitoxin system HicB family antitoxin [candidate division WOR-3 bacterium]
MKRFKILYRPEPEGGYTAIVPSLPGCISYGETLKEARQMIEDAIRCHLKCMAEHAEECCDDTDCLVEDITVEDG